MDKSKQALEGYLKQPYSRLLIPDEESGTYTAQILEFPGCIAQGDTVNEAYERLEKAASAWIQTVLDLGQDVPPPASIYEYGGKVALRLPKSLHRQVANAAERDGTSLNQFIVAAVAEKVGATKFYADLVDKIWQRLYKVQFDETVLNKILKLRLEKEAENSTDWPNLPMLDYQTMEVK